MELTIDDCMGIAARESATEHELRAAVCVAVGQALHYRYEARGYSEAAETAMRREVAADEMVAALRHERDAALAEAKAARESAADTARLRESVTALRADFARVAAERDDARSIAAMHERERDRAVQEREEAGKALANAGKVASQAVREREEFSLRLSAAERQRDEARIRVEALGTQLNAAIARPTYEARETMPTPEELEAHEHAGALWLVRTAGRASHILKVYRHTLAIDVSAVSWLPIGADGLPCAWPVVP